MKLAIVIEGEQNSGKTSTIRAMINLFTGRKLVQMKRGWQQIFLNPTFKSLKLNCYCIPASPSETGIKIGDRLKGFTPRILIVAEQPSGQYFSDTYNFLNANGYSIETFSIHNTIGRSTWERFDVSSQSAKMKARADEILNSIKLFLKTNSIV